MPAHIVTTEDLLSFKQELLDDLKSFITEYAPKEKRWLRSPEVRKKLNISPGTLQNLRVNGTLPYTKIGGVIYYDDEDILRVLEENKITPHQP